MLAAAQTNSTTIPSWVFTGKSTRTSYTRSGHNSADKDVLNMPTGSRITEKSSLVFHQLVHATNHTFCHKRTASSTLWHSWSSVAMSNPNGLLSQKLCHHLNQGCGL